MRAWLMAWLLLGSSELMAATSLESLLRLAEPPAGVVIEIVEGSEAALAERLPEVQRIAAQLRQRFPGLDVVVVSHGREQFALTQAHAQRYSAIHQLARGLGQEEVELYVCGTHASWYDISPEAYPDYVQVAPSGPAQINDYEALGYLRLVL